MMRARGAEEVAGALRRASGQKWQWRGGAGAGGRGGREQMRDRGAERGSLTGLRRVLSLPPPPPPPPGARTLAQVGQRPRPAQRTFGFLSPQTLGGARGRPGGEGRGAAGGLGRRARGPGPGAAGAPALRPPAGAGGLAGVASAPRGGGRTRGCHLSSLRRRRGRRARAGAAEGRGLRGAA